jgi:hypothetical protein
MIRGFSILGWSQNTFDEIILREKSKRAARTAIPRPSADSGLIRLFPADACHQHHGWRVEWP